MLPWRGGRGPHGGKVQRAIQMGEQFTGGNGIGPQGGIHRLWIDLQQQHLAGIGIETLVVASTCSCQEQWMNPTCSRVIPRVEMR